MSTCVVVSMVRHWLLLLHGLLGLGSLTCHLGGLWLCWCCLGLRISLSFCLLLLLLLLLLTAADNITIFDFIIRCDSQHICILFVHCSSLCHGSVHIGMCTSSCMAIGFLNRCRLLILLLFRRLLVFHIYRIIVLVSKRKDKGAFINQHETLHRRSC